MRNRRECLYFLKAKLEWKSYLLFFKFSRLILKYPFMINGKHLMTEIFLSKQDMQFSLYLKIIKYFKYPRKIIYRLTDANKNSTIAHSGMKATLDPALLLISHASIQMLLLPTYIFCSKMKTERANN